MSDERRLRLVRRLALVAGLCAVACAAAAVLVLSLRPRVFTTHRDAIGYELAQRDIAYEAIYISRVWPDTLTDEYYGAALDVQLPSGRSVPGRLECRVARTRCYFSLASLGIVREPLPELVSEREQPAWMVWLQSTAARLTGQ